MYFFKFGTQSFKFGSQLFKFGSQIFKSDAQFFKFEAPFFKLGTQNFNIGIPKPRFAIERLGSGFANWFRYWFWGVPILNKTLFQIRNPTVQFRNQFFTSGTQAFTRFAEALGLEKVCFCSNGFLSILALPGAGARYHFHRVCRDARLDNLCFPMFFTIILHCRFSMFPYAI